MVYFIFRWS